MTDEEMRECVLPAASSLALLDCEWCDKLTDHSLLALSSQARRLQHLYLGWCSLITDKGLEAVVTNSPFLRCQPINPPPHDVSNIPLCRICTRTLELKNCQRLTDQSLELTARSCSLLENLNLCFIRSLGDRTLQCLVECGCPLQTLNVSYNPNISALALSRLLSGCGASARVLQCVGCPLVDAAKVEALRAEFCQVLINPNNMD